MQEKLKKKMQKELSNSLKLPSRIGFKTVSQAL